MRYIKFLALILAGLSFNAWGQDVNRYLSGSWYNPDQAGHGFSVEVLSPTRTLFYWYSYHPDGTPMFLIADGVNSGNLVTADAHYNTGMEFGEFDPSDRIQTLWGTITLTFHSCNSATMQYDSDMMHNGEAYGSGSISLVRLASIDGVQCSSNPLAGLFTAIYYSDDDTIVTGSTILAPNGEFAVWIPDSIVSVGTWSVNGKNLSSSGIVVPVNNKDIGSGLGVSTGQITDYMSWGNYSVEGGDSGYSESYAVPALYRRGISLDAIAGSYTTENFSSGGLGSASLSSSGVLSGSDSLGCSYQGQLSVEDPLFNLIAVTVTVSNCGPSRTYKGYGAQIDIDNLEDRGAIRLITTDDEFSAVIDLLK